MTALFPAALPRSVAPTLSGLDRWPRADASMLGRWLALVGGLWLVLILGCGVGAAAPAELPALTGRIVDGANLLPTDARASIESKLETLDDKSGIQFVVATVKSLGGEEIEPYANRLFRAWKLGEAKKNNGVLLLVAPAEHKARIEVGYGLEGTLTDALSKLVIVNGMAPRFKAGDYRGGIDKGVDDVIAILSTDAAEWQKRPDLQKPKEEDSGFFVLLPFLIVGGVIVLIVMSRGRRGGGTGGGGTGSFWIPAAGGFVAGSGNSRSSGGSSGSSGGSSGSSGGSSGSSDDGGGFSGGGGSSGGGGASGDW